MSSDNGPLQAHQIALRAAIVAPIAGLVSALSVTVLSLVMGERFDVLPFQLLATLAAGTWCGLLVLSEEVARHARPALRPLLIALVGAGSGALVAAAITWAEALFAGRAPALQDVEGLIDAVRRDPGNALLMTQAALLPFLALGTARAVVGARLPLQAAIGAAAGLAAFGGCCLFKGLPSPRDCRSSSWSSLSSRPRARSASRSGRAPRPGCDRGSRAGAPLATTRLCLKTRSVFRQSRVGARLRAGVCSFERDASLLGQRFVREGAHWS